MEIEQLKLVLETVNGFGENTKLIVCMWLAKDLVMFIIRILVVVFAIKKGFELLHNWIVRSSFHQQLMAEIGTSVFLSGDDMVKVLELVRKGKSAQ